MIDTKINDDLLDESIEHTEGKENKEAQKYYKLTLRSTYDVEVEVDAASAADAICDTFSITLYLDSESSSGLIYLNEQYVGEAAEEWLEVGEMFSDSFSVEVLEGDTWRPCIEDY